MAKKAGLFTLLLGAAAGAAAVFLSSKDHRQQAERELVKAKKLAKEIEKHPEKVAKKVVTRSKKVAAVATGKAVVKTKTAAKTTKRKK